jgi:hypothetical protein
MRWNASGNCVVDTGTNWAHSNAKIIWARGSVTDTDLDGYDDDEDNCVYDANGDDGDAPSILTHECHDGDTTSDSRDAQYDGDLDGYGNICDQDVDQDGAASLADPTAVNNCQKTDPAPANCTTPPDLDINCNGAGDLQDVSITNIAQKAIEVPGPSGLSCADPEDDESPCE